MEQTALPNNFDQLKHLFIEEKNKYQKQLELRDSIIQTLQDELAIIKRMKFGKSSEKWTPDDKKQMHLFNEAEVSCPDLESEGSDDSTQEITYTRKRKGRKPIPPYIPREEIIYDLSEQERCCPHCNVERPELGSEETEELQFIPAKVIVKKHIRKKYGPCKCEAFKNDDLIPVIITAKSPPRIMPGSIASSGLLSYIFTSKFCDAIPFYRMEKIFIRNGIQISRTNMANWTIKVAGKVEPLIELMREKSREGPLINMDESVLQVLKEPNRKPENQSYMWVSVSSDKSEKTVLFNYSQTRNSDVPLSLLKGFKGVLQTDGYKGYGKVVSEYDLYHVGCLAHVRRKFYDAAKLTKSGGLANKAIKIIGKIYRVEKNLREGFEEKTLDSQAFLLRRREEAIPYWKDFHKWLKEMKGMVPPQSKLGEAVGYALNEYSKLVRYLKYSFITVDNNVAERAIRPYVIGRKNWVFSDTPRGAHASAAIYSLIETAKANGLDPQNYLYQIFEKIPQVQDGDREALEALLPWNINCASVT